MEAKIESPPSPTPEDILARIGDALSASAAEHAGNIKVAIEGSRVILRGTVPSWADREIAQAAACSIPGIGPVANEIKVNCG